MRWPTPGPPGILWFHSISSVVVERGAIFVGRFTRAVVVRTPRIVGWLGTWAFCPPAAACAARAPAPAAGGGAPRLMPCPFMVLRVITVPAGNSDGTPVAALRRLAGQMLG